LVFKLICGLLERVRRALRFLALLIVGIGALVFVAAQVVDATTRAWFDKDVKLRAELAVGGSRRALVEHWQRADWPALRDLLSDIARDERILAAAACSSDHRLVTATAGFPVTRFSCAELAGRVFAGGQAHEWHTTAEEPTGAVHLSALPIVDGQASLGFVVLLHDMGYVLQREESTRVFLWAVFGVLAIAASIITLAAARLSWRGWSNELRRLLQRGEGRPEFKPLLQDVRELVDQLAYEKDVGSGAQGTWTAARLKQTLSRHLRGERVVIVANREPYIHQLASDGGVTVLHPASGLVTALEPVMRACSGVWVAHGSGTADRASSDLKGRVAVPPGERSYFVRRVWLSQEEERGYYYGFSNEGLWPLCHIAHARPTFRIDDWRHYQEVNQKFTDAVCDEVDTEDPIILVQDYHFALVPRLIRRRLPRATIITFWHIPWPNAERFGICPWRDEILEGLLGSSILGFHIQLHCNNFVDAVDRHMEARIDREHNAVVHHGRPTLVRAYPISIEWPSQVAARTAPAAECRASVFAELGLRPDALLGVGVDRLDYTKGVEERLLAVERLLERQPALRGRFTFVQLAAPSRTAIPRYRELNDTVEALARRINDRLGTDSYRPIVIHRAHHEPPTVFRYYRAADVCYVSSLHDGMNLVAKEFVAARDDEQGVLVLSSFTGAARELTEALVVNPYDLEEASDALATALRMAPEEQRERMRAMRLLVSEFNVYRWAGRMLVDAARLRRHDRVSGRLGDGLQRAEGAA
jgi:trehalose 6-phosphate synthase